MDNIDFTGSDLSEKEEKILNAAISIFSEKGFSAATTNEIAKKAGVAEGTIFRYFKTKKDILRGILIQMIQIIGGKVVTKPIEKILAGAEDKDMKTLLKEIFYDRMELMDSIFPMVRIVITEALYHEDVREAFYQNVISKMVDVFESVFVKMVENDQIREGLQKRAVMRSAVGNMFIMILQRKLFGDKFQIEDIGKEVDDMIDVLLYGISQK